VIYLNSNSIELIEINSPIIDRLKQTITSTHVNGGIIIKCFKINDSDLLKYPKMIEEHERYFNKFFTSEDIKKAVPELKIEEKLLCKTDFRRTNSFVLDGELGGVIYNGGAYKSFYGTPKEAKKLGEQVCEFMFDDRFLDIIAFHTSNPYSAWFYDVAWDDTWFILDTELNRIWLICMTDTD
jgi:hypothetical protein